MNSSHRRAETFLSVDWKLSPVSDRMGCRYIGPKLDFLPRPDYLIAQAGSDPSNIVDDGTSWGHPGASGLTNRHGCRRELRRLRQDRDGHQQRYRCRWPGQARRYRAFPSCHASEAEEIGLAREALLSESTVVEVVGVEDHGDPNQH